MRIAKRIAYKLWSVNWKIYQLERPFFLVLMSFIAMLTLIKLGTLIVIIPLWILILAFYDWLHETTKEVKE